MLEGRIYKLLAGTYYVDTSLGAIEAKAKGSFRSESVLPRVGDRVRSGKQRRSIPYMRNPSAQELSAAANGFKC